MSLDDDQQEDQNEDPQEHVAQDGDQTPGDPMDEAYPPDDTGPGLFDGPDMPGVNTPIPRAAQIRQGALQRRAPQAKKQTRRVKPSSTRILAKQKQRTALELRKAGATYQDIAEKLGYKDHSAARKAVLRAFNNVVQEPVAELRTIQVERLNHMLMTLWPRVQQGDDQAIRTSLAVMDKIDRLNGTDQAPAPGSVTINNNNQTANSVLVIDGNKDDYITALKKMAGIMGQDGTNALPSSGEVQGRQAPPGMTLDHTHPDVVEAEVIEDTPMSACTSELGTVCKDPECPLHFQRDDSGPDYVRTGEGVPLAPTQRKTYSFGVDPTVKKGNRDAAGTDQGAGAGQTDEG